MRKAWQPHPLALDRLEEALKHQGCPVCYLIYSGSLLIPLFAGITFVFFR